MSALGILPPAERELVLHRFNAVEVAPSRLLHPEQTVHGLLEHWAQATPSAVSAIFEVSKSDVMHAVWHLRCGLGVHAWYVERTKTLAACRERI